MLMKRVNEARLFVAMVLGMALSGCSSGSSSTSAAPAAPSKSTALPAAVSAALTQGTPVDPAIVNANNSFGFQLFQQLQAVGGSNTFISPTSVALALEIAYAGSAGSTETGMARALQLGALNPTSVNSDNAALQASLVSPDPQVTLSIANSLWFRHESGAVLPSFVNTNTNYYGAQLGDVAGAPANVNSWVANATNGKITTLLPSGDYSNTVAIIANVVYFNGKWTTPFNPLDTATTPFLLSGGSTVSVPLMSRTGSFSYVQSGDVQAVKLPYGSGRLAMIVVVPNLGVSLNSFVSELTPANWATWTSGLQTAQGTVELPRFTQQFGASLAPALSSLGMSVAFNPTAADFSGIGPGLYMQFVYHKTYLQVDETGTTAAGATGVGISITASFPGFHVVADHPFFCAIQDTKTGEILFLGVVTNPSQ